MGPLTIAMMLKGHNCRQIVVKQKEERNKYFAHSSWKLREPSCYSRWSNKGRELCVPLCVCVCVCVCMCG